MWSHMNDYGWGWSMGMGLGMLLFWGAVLVALAMLARSPWAKGGHEKSALDLLKERYARGEIGREEFEQKKHDLED